ncbi:MAG: hypothetical protein ACI4PH_04315 [Faecousia sp.]
MKTKITRNILTVFLLLLAVPLAGCRSQEPETPVTTAAPAEETTAATADPAAESPYEDILSAYAQALRENWNGAELMEAGMNYLAAEFQNPEEDVGFLETDLDGNGTPELLIGVLSEEDPFYSKMILSLYALDDTGIPVLVFDGTERNRYYYAGDIRFANLGAGAYNSSFETTVKFQDNEMIDMTYTTDPADYVLAALTPFSQWRDEA